MSNLKLNMNETFLKYFNDDLSELNLIQKMFDHKDCQIMKTGTSRTIMEYYFCNCDINQKDAICKACAFSCHKNHQLSLKYEGEQICSCGIKCHNIDTDSKSNFHKREYIPKCFFQELAINSKKYVLYENYKGEQICIFCNHFCNRLTENTNQILYERKEFASEEDFKSNYKECECKHPDDVKHILRFIINICDQDESQFEDFNPTQIINLLFKCKRSFDNIYGFLEEMMMNKDEIVDLVSDKKMNHSNYYWAITSISSCASNTVIYYFSENVLKLFDIEIIYRIIDRVPEDNNIILNSFAMMLKIYQKFIIGFYFSNYPKIKIADYQNLSPLQRLIIYEHIRNNKFIDTIQKNLLPKYITAFENLVNLKFSYIKGYDVIISICIMIKKFAKFNLFQDEDLMINYCNKLDNFFQLLYNKNKILNNPENTDLNKNSDALKNDFRLASLKALRNILKTLVYLTISHNDSIIHDLIKNEKGFKKPFIHKKNRLGNLISQKVIQILNYIKIELEENQDNESQNMDDESDEENFNDVETKLLISKLVKNILFLGNQLLFVFLDSDDFYEIGLRRCINNNLSLYTRIINHDLLFDKEKSFLDSLNFKSSIIHDSLIKYYNFDIKLSELELTVCKSISDFFQEIEMSHYKLPEIDLLTELENEERNMIANEDENKLYQKNLTFNNTINYSILMTKSDYIFSITKILEIPGIACYLNPETVEQIFKILYFFIENQPDNCIIALFGNILYSFHALCMSKPEFADSVLDFVIQCLKVMSKFKYQIAYSYFYRKICLDIWSTTKESGNKYSSLYRLLKILKFFLKEIPCLNLQLVIVSIQKIIKFELSKLTDFFDNYKLYLLKLSEHYENNSNSPTEEERIYNECMETLNPQVPKTLAFKIYFKYINLICESFDNNAMFNDREFLETKILNNEQILKILKNMSLDIGLRIEIVKCFRMIYVDVSIDSKNIVPYRKEFCDKLDLPDNTKNNNLKIYVFLEKLMEISGHKLNVGYEYSIILNEIKNFDEIIEKSVNKDNKILVREYFENAIILPLKIYLNKVFSVVGTMSGEDFLKVYVLAYYFLLTKHYILENNYYSQNINNQENNYSMSRSKPYEYNLSMNRTFINNLNQQKGGKSVINVEKLNEQELEDVINDIKVISNENYKILDHVSIYHIINKHLINFIAHPTSSILINYFSKNEEYENEKSEDFRQNLEIQGFLMEKNKLDNFLFDLIIDYKSIKKDFDNSSIKSNLNETPYNQEVNYRNLLLHFLFFLSTQKYYPGENYTKEANEVILKLLQAETSQTQSEILKLYTNKNQIDLKQLGEYCFTTILSIIFSQYNPSSVDLSDDYYVCCHVIKIFKFLCEEHNNFFQNILMQKLSFNIDDSKIIMFFDMMILVLDKIILLSGWDNVKGNPKENYDYYYALFSCIIELLIEIIQGTKTENFSYLYKANIDDTNIDNIAFIKTKDPIVEESKALPLFLENIKSILFNDSSSNETILKVRKELVDFLLAFMEEHSCPSNINEMIMSSFSPQTILRSIGATLKQYYINNVINRDGSLFENENLEVKPKIGVTYTVIDKSLNVKQEDVKKKKFHKLYKYLKFNEKMQKYYSFIYENDEEFSNSPEFELCNKLYIYFKLSIESHEHAETKSYLEKVNSVNESTLSIFNKKTNKFLENVLEISDIDKKIDESDLESYYVIKLFEQICRSILVTIENVKKPVKVVYTVSPLLNYLSINSKLEFLRTVNRDNRFSKLYNLMEQTLYFKQEIDFNSNLKNNIFVKIANQIDYFYVATASFFVAAIINIAVLFVMQEGGISYYGYNSLELIEAFSFVLFAFNVLFLLTWCLTKLPLYFIIETTKYSDYKKVQGLGPINLWDKIIVVIRDCILFRKEISTIIWISVFMFLGASSRSYDICYTISLLSVINLSKLLNNIALSVIMKGRQLAWASLFNIIIVYIWAAWGFFYDNSRFWDVSGRDEPVNYCETLIYCFLHAVTIGLRKHEGIGRYLYPRSYFVNSAAFVQKTFYDTLFFLVITIIMMKIIFGIIIDTFRVLRGDAFNMDYDMANVCFICGANKDALFKKGENFHEHVDKTHDVWGYVNYMITLRGQNSQDLNMINSYCKENIEKKSVIWLPENLDDVE